MPRSPPLAALLPPLAPRLPRWCPNGQAVDPTPTLTPTPTPTLTLTLTLTQWAGGRPDGPRAIVQRDRALRLQCHEAAPGADSISSELELILYHQVTPSHS